MMTLRKALGCDVELINQLVNSAYRGESSKAGWTTEAAFLGGQRTDSEKILEMISDPNSQIETLFDESELVGCVYLRRESDALYFGMLTVKPLLQNNGLGKILLTHIESIAKDWGQTVIRMEVIHLRKELIDYYESRGYRWTGKTAPFPENDPRFGLPKTKLEFLVYEKNLSGSPK
jgi:ribosomal protein S18 acetylase RimI-like enzyme